MTTNAPTPGQAAMSRSECDGNRGVRIRPMQAADRDAVAELIHASTNYWYAAHGRGAIFGCGPEDTRLFVDVYEALDPGQGLVAVHAETDRLMGSCFVHPRPTHVSLGIMNVHPSYFGRGVAGQLLRAILARADEQGKAVRLVSSAINLDSYSLYTRHGFVPRAFFQDMMLPVPQAGLAVDDDDLPRTRDATLEDVDAIVALEREIAGIERGDDFRHFIRNDEGIWGISVTQTPDGELQGVMASCGHAACSMIGPGMARSPEAAAALLLHELNRRPGVCPVFVVPADCGPLVQRLYRWGARNCELHVAQVRGESQPLRGLWFPTFMPETG